MTSTEVMRPVEACPEEGHKNDQGNGMLTLCGQAKRAGAAQTGEEKAPGRSESEI